MMRKTILAALLLPLLSGGCVAQAAWDVATLPVKAVAKTADVLTVSSKERDEHYAHKQRKLAEQRRKAAKQEAKRAREAEKRAARRDCDRGIDSDLS